jgi:hypothetical protein
MTRGNQTTGMKEKKLRVVEGANVPLVFRGISIGSEKEGKAWG